MPFLSLFFVGIFGLIVLLITKNNITRSEIDKEVTLKDSTYYFGMFISLSFSVYALLYVVFGAIDKYFNINQYYYTDRLPTDLAMMIATLIVVYPLYLFFSYAISNELKKNLMKKDSSIRKATIYISIVVTALTVVGVIITTIYTFLIGGIVTAFILKASVTLFVALLLFFYFYYTLKRDYAVFSPIPNILTFISAIFVFALIFWSIKTFGIPQHSGDNNDYMNYRTQVYTPEVPSPAPKSDMSSSAVGKIDYNYRIAYWYGKVNQHVGQDGKWTTDPDGTSGADIDKLTYCKKWYPNTTSVVELGKETISGWKDAGNTGNYTSTVPVYVCVF